MFDRKIIFIVLLLGCFAGCAKTMSIGDANKENDMTRVAENAIDQSDKKVIDVVYRVRDYSQAPKEYNDVKELEPYLKKMSGRASFRILETGKKSTVGNVNAKDGKEFFYVVFEIKGNKSNPVGGKISPSMVEETGWDPAPQPVIVVNGKSKYSSGYNGDLNREMGFNVSLTDKLDNTGWQKRAMVWIVDVGAKPELAIGYVGVDDTEKMIKIDY